jgi:F0F1-type ATP synthase gamma subunit
MEDFNGPFNCLRQSVIDEEVLDIISGLEALSGAEK